MSELSIEDKFCTVLGETFDNISVIIGELNARGKTDINGAMVTALKQFILSRAKDYSINSFIEGSNKFWEQIRNKDEKCMLENSHIILGEHANKPEFSSVKLIFTSEIDHEAKSFLWDCLHALVKLSIKYIFIERGTTVTRENRDGKSILKVSYKKKSFHENIDIPKCSKAWNLGLY